MLGLAMEEPGREIKHNAVHFPVDWEDAVIRIAGFGQGSSVPEESFTTEVTSHRAFDSAQRPGSTRGAPKPQEPTTAAGRQNALVLLLRNEVRGVPE